MLNIPSLPRLRVNVDDPSESAGNVFRRFTSACVQSGSLDFLSLLDGMDTISAEGTTQARSSARTPSWTPDYAGNPDFLSLLDGVDTLSSEETSQARTGGSIPSWVPNYAISPDLKIGTLGGTWEAGGRTGGTFPSFCGTIGTCLPPKIKDTKLMCSAAVVDTIESIGGVSRPDLRNKMLAKHLDGNTGVQQSTTAASALPSARDIIYKVFVGGCDLSGSKEHLDDFKALYNMPSGKLMALLRIHR